MDVPLSVPRPRPSRADLPASWTPASPHPAGALPAEDADLLERMRRGDRSGYETLVRRYLPEMLTVARRFVDEAEARESVRAAFLAAVRSSDALPETGPLSDALRHLVLREVFARKRRSFEGSERSIEGLLPAFLDDGHAVDPAAIWPNPSDSPLSPRDRAALVRRCIDSLPAPYRAVLLLRDVEGVETRVAARLLAISEGALKVRLHRARQALRALLDPHVRE
jgi:DNA-directed RNA polymerase specialized sigma subunit, sigma24 homolog